MITDKFGQIVLNQTDLLDLIMQNRDLCDMKKITVDSTVSIEQVVHYLDHVPDFLLYNDDNSQAIASFDYDQQHCWHMPEEYKTLDIAQHVLSLCQNQTELQRVGEELLLYQERDLFDLLRYLKYLVDVVNEKNVIMGVGRGSSVASYVLYKLGVHCVDSMYYDLDITEFLR